MRPGQTAVQEFQLGNDTSARVKIRAYAWDWWITEKNDKIFGPPGRLSPALHGRLGLV